MRPNRRIDTTSDAVLFFGDDFTVKRFAHAVQTLKLKATVVARHFEYERDGMCVVGGKLRIQGIARRPQAFGAG